MLYQLSYSRDIRKIGGLATRDKRTVRPAAGSTLPQGLWSHAVGLHGEPDSIGDQAGECGVATARGRIPIGIHELRSESMVERRTTQPLEDRKSTRLNSSH